MDGIITIPLDTNPVHLESVRRRNIPVVLIDRTVHSFEADAVIVDNFDAGKMAAEHLLSKGHKKAAIISGLSKFKTMAERQRGFLSMFSKSGGDFSTHKLETNFTIEGGYKAVKELLAAPCKVSALFCTNYELTLGAVVAMNELGIRFPENISLIGFDNMQLAGLIKPAITIIEQPLEQIAREAAELLLKRLEKKASHSYETVMLKTKFIEGASVAHLNELKQ